MKHSYVTGLAAIVVAMAMYAQCNKEIPRTEERITSERVIPDYDVTRRIRRIREVQTLEERTNRTREQKQTSEVIEDVFYFCTEAYMADVMEAYFPMAGEIRSQTEEEKHPLMNLDEESPLYKANELLIHTYGAISTSETQEEAFFDCWEEITQEQFTDSWIREILSVAESYLVIWQPETTLQEKYKEEALRELRKPREAFLTTTYAALYVLRTKDEF